MNHHTLLFLALGPLALASCKNDKDEPAAPYTPADERPEIRMAMAFMNGDEPYTPGTLLTDGNGHQLRLSQARFFVSKVHVINDEEELVGDFPDTYMLANAANATNAFTLGRMQALHMHQFILALGLDHATNHSDPTLYTTAPLNDATMHWSWNPDMGYKFLALEGRVDDDGDGVVDDSDPEFTYHCAGDGLLTADSVHVHHTLAENETFTLNVQVDMGVLFNGVDVLVNPMEMGTTPLTTQVMHNLSEALDEVE